MTFSRPDVLVIGAGVIGLSVAVRLQSRGLRTQVVAPSEGLSASDVAAGMIAPVMEAATDPMSASLEAALTGAAGLWPGFADQFGLGLQRRGCLWLSSCETGLRSGVETVTPVQARELAPWLAHDLDLHIAYAPAEACVTPAQALAALRCALQAAGGELTAGRAGWRDGAFWRDDVRLSAACVVLATGYGGVSFAEAAPELGLMAPIRGQIVRALDAGIGDNGPCVRGPGAYVAPQRGGGAMIGATMEPGETEAVTDVASLSRLMAAATAFAPGLKDRPHVGLAAIRAATPDGAPMVGPASSFPGLFLATGMRRNGWLLAPLVADMICAYLAGEDPGVHAGTMAPKRFIRTCG